MAFALSVGAKIYWDQVSSDHVDSDQVSSDQTGEGAPLLLIMGLGFPSDMWFRLRPALAEKYRTIAFDNRGAGRSDLTPGPYSMALLAADAAAVLDAAGVERAHILGISMGGMIAQELAIEHPARVGSLILGCTASRGPLAVPAEEAAVELLTARGEMLPEDAAQAAIPFVYSSGTPRERIDEDLAVRRPWFPTPEGYIAQLQAIFDWESYSRLGKIHAPTLVIHGEDDRLVPAANARILADNIPHARLMLLPRASHIFWTDQPEQTRRAILEFLEEQPRAAVR